MLPQLHPGFVPHRSEPEETLQLIAYTWMTGLKLASTVIEGIKEGRGAMRKELLQDAILRYQRDCGQLIKATNDARNKVMRQYHTDDPRRQLIISDEERQKRQLVVEVIPLFLDILTHRDKPFAHVWPEGCRIRGNAAHKARAFTRWLCQISTCTSLERTAKTG
jgi:hypothetical protein